MPDAPEMEAVATEESGLEAAAGFEGLMAEESSEAAPNTNPFALDADHEFSSPAPDAPPEVDRVDVHRVAGSGAMTLIGSGAPGGTMMDLTPAEPPPAMPGTPESIFRHCPCIGVMPGRACPRCAGTKWVKTCPKCEGAMFRTVQTRRGAHARTERCGFCMGLGQVPARLSEVREAEEAAKAYTPAPATGKPVYARGPQLPGVRQNGFAARAAKKGAGLANKRRGVRGRQRSA